MTALLAAVANIVLVAAALGFGTLLRNLFPEDFSFLDRVAFMLVGGLGLQGVLLFCAGQFWFSRTAIVLVLISGVLLGLIPFASATRTTASSLRRFSPPVPAAVIIAAVLAITAIAGLAEVTGDMKHDSIAYHYLGPTVWLRDKVIHPVPDEVLTAFPAVTETQYAALISLGGRRAPGLFAVTSLIALLLIAASLAVRLGLSEPAAWWTAALLLTMPALYRGAYGGFVDVLFSAFVLAAARVTFAAQDRRHYVILGLFCGFAMSSKYTGIVSCCLLLTSALLISLWGRRVGGGSIFQCLAIAAGSATVVSSPFYLRNWALFGCPIYPPPPILLRFFSVRVTPFVLRELERNVRETGIGMGTGFWNFLLLPFHLTYYSADFRGAGGIGLAPLALAPFGMWICRRSVFARGLMLFATLQTAAWFATAQVSRYLIPVYAIAGIFAVAGWQYIASAGSRAAKALCGLVVAISIGYGVIMIVPERRDDFQAAMSPLFESQRRLRETRFIESFDYLNAEPAVTKVLIVDPYVAGYFSEKPYIKPTGRWGEQSALLNAADLPEILLSAPVLHFSHVLDVGWTPGGFRLPEHSEHLTLVFARADQRIYRVDESPPPQP